MISTNSVQNHFLFFLLKNLKIKIYKIIILSDVLYGSETWSLTQREVHKLRIFENRVLRSILGPKMEEFIEGWTKLHNKEFRNLYASPNIIRVMKSRRMRWARHVARIRKVKNIYKILAGKPEGKTLLGRSRSR
jgi:hypothetical protein